MPPDTGQQQQIDRTSPTMQSAPKLEYHEASAFRGPIPPPSLFAEYEAVMPGAAKRILANWESQTKHRQRMETIVIENDTFRSKASMICATVIAVVAIIGGTYVVAISSGSTGMCAAGAAIAGTPLAGILTAFLKGTNSRREEREKKAEAMATKPRQNTG